MSNFKKRLIPIIVALAIAFGIVVPAFSIAATNYIPDVVALFTTSLQSPITATQTTMNLVSSTYDGGAYTLPASTYGFIIDEGTSVEELVQADCTATVCTNMTRGLSRYTGTTTVTALEFAHRRGASVKITNAPVLLIINRILEGIGTFPNKISFASHPTFTSDTNIVDKKYVDDISFSGSGAIAATESASGYSRLATPLQQASSTATAGGSPLVLQSKNASSTFTPTANGSTGLNVVVTQNNNKIDNNFISSSTLLSPALTFNSNTGNATISGTTTYTPSTFIDSSGNQPMWSFLASTTYDGSSASFTLSSIPSRTFIHTVMFLDVVTNTGLSAPFKVYFNGDTGANYAASSTLPIGANTPTTGDSGIKVQCISCAGGSGLMMITMDIYNISTTTQLVSISALHSGYLAGTGLNNWKQTQNITAIWAPSTAQRITSISVLDANGTTAMFRTNSKMFVYGSSF